MKEVSAVALGATLRDARLSRNLTLAEAERDTKVRQVFLSALEQERFDLLPPRAFARGLLWVYARYLGLEPQPLVEQLPPEPADPAPENGARPSVSWSKVILFIVLLLALAVLIGVCNFQRFTDR